MVIFLVVFLSINDVCRFDFNKDYKLNWFDYNVMVQDKKYGMSNAVDYDDVNGDGVFDGRDFWAMRKLIMMYSRTHLRGRC